MADATHSSPESSVDNEAKKAQLIKELMDLVIVCRQFADAFNLDINEAMNEAMNKAMKESSEQLN